MRVLSVVAAEQIFSRWQVSQLPERAQTVYANTRAVLSHTNLLELASHLLSC